MYDKIHYKLKKKKNRDITWPIKVCLVKKKKKSKNVSCT